MAYNTNNPLGSKDPKDLYDNATNFDLYSNGPDPMYPNRFGALKLSIEGMNEQFNSAQEGRTVQFQAFLEASGFVFIGDYGAGINFTSRTQYTVRDGVLYRLAPTVTLPYTTTGNWAIEQTNFVAFDSDDILMQDLANTSDPLKGSAMVGHKGRTVRDVLSDRINVKDFGALIDGTTDDTASFQAAYDAATAGATIFVPGYVAVVGAIAGTKFVVWETDALTPGGDPLALPGVVSSTLATRKVISRKGVATDYSSLQITREANFTGGSPGFVSTAFTVDTAVSAGATNFEWNALFKLSNSAVAGENVALYSQATKLGVGPTWAGCFEIRDQTPRDPAEGAAIGIELSCTAAPGADTNRQRNGVNIAISRIGASGISEWGRGFWVSHDGNSRVREAFTNTAAYTEAVYQNNATVSAGIGRGALLLDLGSGTVGVDTSSATYSTGVAVKLASGQKVSFEATNAVNISYTGGVLAMVGARFQVSSGLAFPSSGLTSTSAVAGGATALPAAPATYLSVWVDGTLRKIPLYA